MLDELKASKLLPLLKYQSSGGAQHAVSISLARSRSVAEAKPSVIAPVSAKRDTLAPVELKV